MRGHMFPVALGIILFGCNALPSSAHALVLDEIIRKQAVLDGSRLNTHARRKKADVVVGTTFQVSGRASQEWWFVSDDNHLFIKPVGGKTDRVTYTKSGDGYMCFPSRQSACVGFYEPDDFLYISPNRRFIREEAWKIEQWQNGDGMGLVAEYAEATAPKPKDTFILKAPEPSSPAVAPSVLESNQNDGWIIPGAKN